VNGKFSGADVRCFQTDGRLKVTISIGAPASLDPDSKSRVKHIFIKLNVEKRVQVVSRAQILGLAGTQQ
jgi:hypothetical protein